MRCATLIALFAVAPLLHGIEVTDRLVTSGYRPGRVAGDPLDTIVVHFCSDVLAHPKKPYDLATVVRLFAPSTSAHYLIDRQGIVCRLVKETDTAYHAGAGRWGDRINTLNRFSIGIELMGIGTADEMQRLVAMPRSEYRKVAAADLGFTARQYSSLAALISDLEARHPLIKHDRRHVIGHDEYARGRKFDPGRLFDWTKIGLPTAPSPP